MKGKVFAALLMTLVMSLAAFASEQRRMCIEHAPADDSVVMPEEGQETIVLAMETNVTN